MTTLRALPACAAVFFCVSTAALACDQTEVAVTTTPVPEQSAGTLRQALAVASAAKRTAPPEAVIIGDSLVARWPQDLLKSTLVAPAVFNMGVEGDRTQNALWRLNDNIYKSWKPKTVAMLIGTNNLSAGDSSCSIIAGINQLVAKMDAIWGHPSLVLFSILPRGDGWSFRQSDRGAINDALAQIAAARPATTVITYDDRLTCGSSANCENFVQDKIHLSPAGYEAIKLYVRRPSHGAH